LFIENIENEEESVRFQLEVSSFTFRPCLDCFATESTGVEGEAQRAAKSSIDNYMKILLFRINI
jgi:hypothetical protein